ncbi:MAG: hypothetical protein JO309_09010 [Pseudonocardiales bacterium]|nr:hypothetical protein [Pseudonocardiales bacterium]MBV9729524.1 hypothetical protein [Pseudonocardiales bacterium]
MRSAGLGTAGTAGTAGSVCSRTPGTGKPSGARAAGSPVSTGETPWSALATACSDCPALPTVATAAACGGEHQTVAVEGGGCSVVSLGARHGGSTTAYATTAPRADGDGEFDGAGAGR